MRLRLRASHKHSQETVSNEIWWARKALCVSQPHYVRYLTGFFGFLWRDGNRDREPPVLGIRHKFIRCDSTPLGLLRRHLAKEE
jgi:hypothetical protein